MKIEMQETLVKLSLFQFPWDVGIRGAVPPVGQIGYAPGDGADSLKSMRAP